MKTESPQSGDLPREPFFTFDAKAADNITGQLAQGIVSGLNLDGCLFQSPHLFSIGTILLLKFLLSGRPIEISAIVRRASPDRSLQLEFFAFDSAQSLQYLQDWLAANSFPRSSEE